MHSLRSLALLLLFLTACVPECGGLNPDCKPKCADVGECGKRTYRAGDGYARCFVRDGNDCAQSRVCKDEGRCHLYDGITPDRCVALTDLDCRASTGCAREGKCSLGRLGECVAEPADCARTDACRDAGICAHEHGRGCVAGPAECKASCRFSGACELRDGVCVATGAEHCAKSSQCRGTGQCTLDGDRCVASDEACAASSDCELNGWCTAVDGGDGCYDGRTACGRLCWARGDCTRIDGICQPENDDHCARSVACAVEGRCAYPGRSTPLCGATDDAHCEASLECKAFGRCTRKGIACAGEGPVHLGGACIGRPECETEGRCLMSNDGACVTAVEAGLPDWQPPPMIP
ncbi:hypothetical protein [Paraliomyxa miuraensis]|uniref:hypothetical protein n=1 Tax=Paraliomyxa miuraensis TaxID=376150 RepID=UPI0022519F6C|nr:hypothetical protein [Paraliomyxa miuraensis]MCX4240028.1 hypothetical protein [Paraliomyxa miuraensis]